MTKILPKISHHPPCSLENYVWYVRIRKCVTMQLLAYKTSNATEPLVSGLSYRTLISLVGELPCHIRPDFLRACYMLVLMFV